jgi:hypothetical protein
MGGAAGWYILAAHWRSGTYWPHMAGASWVNMVVHSRAAIDKARPKQPYTPPPRTQIMQPGVYLEHIRSLENQLAQAMFEAGRLRERLDQQQHRIDDQQRLYEKIAEQEQEIKELRRQVDEERRRNRSS